MRWNTPLIRICVLLGLLPAAHADLASRFEDQKNLLSQAGAAVPGLSDDLRETLEAYSFVFVDGILGDLTRTLYKSSLSYLARELQEDADLRVIRPSSFRSVDENADALASEILRAGARPKIVLAHSRGAAELFVALLKNPEIFEQANIKKVVLVQGAFSGSPLAEWTANALAKGCGERDHSAEGLLAGLCGFSEIFSKSLQALVPQAMRELRLPLQRGLGESDKALFMERVFFVRSSSSVGATQLPLKPSALYLQRYYYAFENDGILLTMQQRLRGFGKDLGVLHADHLGLLGDSKKRPYDQVAFLRALLAEIAL